MAGWRLSYFPSSVDVHGSQKIRSLLGMGWETKVDCFLGLNRTPLGSICWPPCRRSRQWLRRFIVFYAGYKRAAAAPSSVLCRRLWHNRRNGPDPGCSNWQLRQRVEGAFFRRGLLIFELSKFHEGTLMNHVDLWKTPWIFLLQNFKNIFIGYCHDMNLLSCSILVTI